MFNISLTIIFYLLLGLISANFCKEFGKPIWVSYCALLGGPLSCIVIFVWLFLYVIRDSYNDVGDIFKD
jgi:hypothetical protein